MTRHRTVAAVVADPEVVAAQVPPAETEVAFVAGIQKDLNARFPTPADAEKAGCVVITNTSNQSSQHFIVIGQLAALGFSADELTQDAPEVLMPRKRHERP